jgi:CheY-like chemotaxis protein
MLRTEPHRSANSSTPLPSLRGRHILVVEDDYVLAMDMRLTLEDVGAEVIGPVGTVRDALRMVEREHIDAAVLDIELHGELVFAVAERLQDDGVPFAFATAYEGDILPRRFTGAPRYQKPISAEAVVNALAWELAEHVS